MPGYLLFLPPAIVKNTEHGMIVMYSESKSGTFQEKAVRTIIFYILLGSLILAGCSATSLDSPTSPSPQQMQTEGDSAGRLLWGIWDIYIPADRTGAEIVPIRTADMHLNVVRLLEVSPCASCLTIGNLRVVGPNELLADVTLAHPFPGLLKYTGFDVRGIFISEADYSFPANGKALGWGGGIPRIISPDGYTGLFNPIEYPETDPPALGYIPGKYAPGGDLTATLNPFMAYKKDEPRRMFEAGTAGTKTFDLFAPPGPIHFGYAVDASWVLVEDVSDPIVDFPPEANCPEPYRIDVIIDGGLSEDIGSSVPVRAAVYDHQGRETVSAVTIEAPGLFQNELPLSFTGTGPNGEFNYDGAITNDLAAAIGEYPVLVRAMGTSTDPTFGEMSGWQLGTVNVGPLRGWARTWGGEESEEAEGLAVDSTGNIYVVGPFGPTADFDPGPGVDERVSIGSRDCYLTKYDNDGNMIWTRTWGGELMDSCHAVCVDGSNFLYVAGAFYDTTDFDPGPGIDSHECNGECDAYLAKYDSDGNYIWVRVWGGLAVTAVDGLAFDVIGNIYVAGVFEDTVDFDPGPGIDERTANYRNIFISKFNTNGEFIWVRNWYGRIRDEGHIIAVYHTGLFVTGQFNGTVDFDPGPGVDERICEGLYDAFLTSFDFSGNYTGVQSWGGPGDEAGFDVAVNNLSEIFVIGQFFGTVDFDPGTGIEEHTSYGGDECFISAFRSIDEFEWAGTWGSPNNDRPHGVTTDKSDNCYIVGEFWETADMDPGAGVELQNIQRSKRLFPYKTGPERRIFMESIMGGIQQRSG